MLNDLFNLNNMRFDIIEGILITLVVVAVVDVFQQWLCKQL